MSQHRLLASSAQGVPKDLSAGDFLWRPLDKESSFHTSVGPRLEGLGPVPELHADFVRLAVLVYLVDRTTPRGSRGWERELELTIPVREPGPWEDSAPALADLLNFLSGDAWTLSFRKSRLPRKGKVSEVKASGPVCLFSGGADSLSGSVILGEERQQVPVLTSHWDWTTIGGFQRQLVERLEDIWGVEPEHVQVRVGRKPAQLGTGARFREEGSSRTRSILFIALGLAAAAARETSLIVAENGFASLNVPLAGERRAALSTRTTHPAFLDGLTAVLRDVGLRADIENPFQDMTKGAVFAKVRDILGADQASELLSSSHSCAKPSSHYFGLAPGTHCGLCFGCLVRRAAFVAAGIEDRTEYAEQSLSGTKRKRYVTAARRGDYETVQFAVARGVGPADVLSIGLPERIRIRDALKLARDGLKELAEVEVA